jgi:basic amino acid/polyamine antiporter, APA family
MDKSDSRGLKPALGLIDATAISVGAIIGAGIYVVIGIVAGLAGPALIISMILAAVVALFTALSFAELSAWLPREGSVYEFSYRLISPFAGFLAGWMYMLGNAFAGAAVALGFAFYFTELFPFASPKIVALLLCLAFTIINFFGIRQSAKLNDILVGAKLLILSFFLILGLGYLRPENFHPFAPSGKGIIFGACYIFFAFGGFARVSVLAEEIEDAEHNVPRAILLSLLISTIFYLLIGTVAVGLVGASALAASSSPLAEAIKVTRNPFAVSVISLGGLVATASVLLTSILGVSREAYAMALRDALPSSLSRLHPVHGTPYLSVWISGLIMALMVLSIDLEKVVAVSTFGLLFYYILANFSDAKLRLQGSKNLLLPILGATSCLALLVFLLFISPYAWALGVLVLAAGSIFYKLRNKSRNINLR